MRARGTDVRQSEENREQRMENRERWLWRSRLTSHYTVGDHMEMRGNEAAVAFCILSILI